MGDISTVYEMFDAQFFLLLFFFQNPSIRSQNQPRPQDPLSWLFWACDNIAVTVIKKQNMAAQVPATLKGIQPYLKIAQEYEKRDAVVAYYCKYGSNIAAGVCFVQQTQLLSFYFIPKKVY